MIKGIDKQIIEINNIDNPYYERAFLIVSPEYEKIEKNILKNEANSFLNALDKPSSIKKSSCLFYWAIRLGTSALIGSVITAIIINL